MSYIRPALLVAAISFSLIAPGVAMSVGPHALPGPVAGAGLPFLIVAGAVGAYRLIRRRRQENRQPTGGVE